MFKVKDRVSEIYAEVFSSKLRTLLKLQNKRCDVFLYKNKYFGVLIPLEKKYRKMNIKDYSAIINNKYFQDMLLKEFVFDLLVMDFDSGIRNVLISNNMNKIIRIDHDNAKVFAENSINEYKRGADRIKCCALKERTYDYLFFLHKSGKIVLDFEIGKSFAELIQEYPENIIKDELSTVHKEYLLKNRSIQQLLERKRNLVDIYNKELYYKLYIEK